MGSQSLPILVRGENVAPEVRIFRPEPADEFVEGTSVTFSGSATDDRGTSTLSIDDIADAWTRRRPP